VSTREKQNDEPAKNGKTKVRLKIKSRSLVASPAKPETPPTLARDDTRCDEWFWTATKAVADGGLKPAATISKKTLRRGLIGRDSGGVAMTVMRVNSAVRKLDYLRRFDAWNK
jgi:hypothetical protein